MNLIARLLPQSFCKRGTGGRIGIHQTVSTGRDWTTVFLVFCNIASVVLFLSWYRTQEITVGDGGRKIIRYAETENGNFWKNLDYAAFKTLNGSLRDRKPAQIFWALINTRATDSMSAAFMVMVMWFGLVVRKTPVEKLKYAKAGLFLALSVFILDRLLPLTLFDFRRPSASLEIPEGVVKLSDLEYITWSLKEVSSCSFPGDHGAVLFACAIYIARFATWRWGIAAFLVAILFTLPRLVVGAHWATDILVGSAFTALLGSSWVFWLAQRNIGTGLFHHLAIFLMKLTGQKTPSKEDLLRTPS